MSTHSLRPCKVYIFFIVISFQLATRICLGASPRIAYTEVTVDKQDWENLESICPNYCNADRVLALTSADVMSRLDSHGTSFHPKAFSTMDLMDKLRVELPDAINGDYLVLMCIRPSTPLGHMCYRVPIRKKHGKLIAGNLFERNFSNITDAAVNIVVAKKHVFPYGVYIYSKGNNAILLDESDWIHDSLFSTPVTLKVSGDRAHGASRTALLHLSPIDTGEIPANIQIAQYTAHGGSLRYINTLTFLSNSGPKSIPVQYGDVFEVTAEPVSNATAGEVRFQLNFKLDQIN